MTTITYSNKTEFLTDIKCGYFREAKTDGITVITVEKFGLFYDSTTNLGYFVYIKNDEGSSEYMVKYIGSFDNLNTTNITFTYINAESKSRIFTSDGTVYLEKSSVNYELCYYLSDTIEYPTFKVNSDQFVDDDFRNAIIEKGYVTCCMNTMTYNGTYYVNTGMYTYLKGNDNNSKYVLCSGQNSTFSIQGLNLVNSFKHFRGCIRMNNTTSYIYMNVKSFNKDENTAQVELGSVTSDIVNTCNVTVTITYNGTDSYKMTIDGDKEGGLPVGGKVIGYGIVNDGLYGLDVLCYFLKENNISAQEPTDIRQLIYSNGEETEKYIDRLNYSITDVYSNSNIPINPVYSSTTGTASCYLVDNVLIRFDDTLQILSLNDNDEIEDHGTSEITKSTNNSYNAQMLWKNNKVYSMNNSFCWFRPDNNDVYGSKAYSNAYLWYFNLVINGEKKFLLQDNIYEVSGYEYMPLIVSNIAYTMKIFYRYVGQCSPSPIKVPDSVTSGMTQPLTINIVMENIDTIDENTVYFDIEATFGKKFYMALSFDRTNLSNCTVTFLYKDGDMKTQTFTGSESNGVITLTSGNDIITLYTNSGYFEYVRDSLIIIPPNIKYTISSGIEGVPDGKKVIPYLIDTPPALLSSITVYTNNNYNDVSEVSSDWENRIIQLAKDISEDITEENTITFEQLLEKYKESDPDDSEDPFYPFYPVLLDYIKSVQFLFVSYRVGERVFTVQYTLKYNDSNVEEDSYQVKEMVIYKSIGERFKPISYIKTDYTATLLISNVDMSFGFDAPENDYFFLDTYGYYYHNSYYNYSKNTDPTTLYMAVFSKSP